MVAACCISDERLAAIRTTRTAKRVEKAVRLFPERDDFFGADPAGLAVFEGEAGPAEESVAIGESEASGRERGGFLRVVGFGWNRAKRAGTPGEDGVGVRGEAIRVEAGGGNGGGEEAEQECGEGGEKAEAGRMAVSAVGEEREGGGDQEAGGEEGELPGGGAGEAGKRLGGAGRKKGDERAGDVSGFLGREGELPADGVVGRVLNEGGGGVRGGLGPAILLGEREGEVVARDGVGGGFCDGGGPGFRGRGEVARAVGDRWFWVLSFGF